LGGSKEDKVRVEVGSEVRVGLWWAKFTYRPSKYYFRVGTSGFGYFGYRGLIPELPIIISGTGVYYPKW